MQLAVEYEDNALFVKVDTDYEYEFAKDMKVQRVIMSHGSLTSDCEKYEHTRFWIFFVDEDGHVKKKPQVSAHHCHSVMLYPSTRDHVETGANTCIDRGSWRETMI
ncbi:unnamed protein product [Urochloa humidicola]